jgi:hypothetical protein
MGAFVVTSSKRSAWYAAFLAKVAPALAALRPRPRLTPDAKREAFLEAARAELGNDDPTRYFHWAVLSTVTGHLDWCGVFALAMLKQVELAPADWWWSFGKDGKWGFLYRLERTEDPRPGDLYYMDQPKQHHGIVEEVFENAIATIDGNSTGGAVCRNRRTLAEVSAFYSIEELCIRQ